MTAADILNPLNATTTKSINDESFTMDKMREALAKVCEYECSPISSMKFVHGKGREADAAKLSAIIGAPVMISPYVPDGMMIGISNFHRAGELPQIVVVETSNNESI